MKCYTFMIGQPQTQVTFMLTINGKSEQDARDQIPKILNQLIKTFVLQDTELPEIASIAIFFDRTATPVLLDEFEPNSEAIRTVLIMGQPYVPH